MEGSGSGWSIRLCGPLRVDAGGRELGAQLPGRQGRLLLAYLAFNRDRAVPRRELIDVLWPEVPPAASETALSALLLGEGALSGRSEVRLTLGRRGRRRRRAGGRGRAPGRRQAAAAVKVDGGG